MKETPLAGHARSGKRFIPPLRQLEGMTTTSWRDQRLPGMLWATLISAHLERRDALSLFREIAGFAAENTSCFDVSLQGIAKLDPETRTALLKLIASRSASVRGALRPLLLFPDLPAHDDWKAHLDAPVPEDDWTLLGKAVQECSYHQDERATDCRWAWVICAVTSGKMKFTGRTEKLAAAMLGYPGNDAVRAGGIRAAEMASSFDTSHGTEWSDTFWRHCFEKTMCRPENTGPEDEEEFARQWDIQRDHLMKETIRVRSSVANHWIAHAKSSEIDYRHAAIFGIVFHALAMLSEVVILRADFAISGRLSLRAIVESYIVLAALLKQDDPEKWKAYRRYGIGQAKLISLKLEELAPNGSGCVDPEVMRMIANEDVWQEFVDIDVGNVFGSNLREVSEGAGLKAVYDKYYPASSGFTHANWFAVREGVFEYCVNPLHRAHHIPMASLPWLPSVTSDSVELINSVLSLLSDAYPSFGDRVGSVSVDATAESGASEGRTGEQAAASQP